METVIAYGIEIKSTNVPHNGQVRITLVTPSTRLADTAKNPSIVPLVGGHAFWSWRVLPTKDLLSLVHGAMRFHDTTTGVTVERRKPNTLIFKHEDLAIIVLDVLADVLIEEVGAIISSMCERCTALLLVGEECGLCGWKP